MIVTTVKEQNETAKAARKVGGYDELVRLSAEYQRLGGKGKLIKENGRYSFVCLTT